MRVFDIYDMCAYGETVKQKYSKVAYIKTAPDNFSIVY
jgi:hypothetical protein